MIKINHVRDIQQYNRKFHYFNKNYTWYNYYWSGRKSYIFSIGQSIEIPLEDSPYRTYMANMLRK